MDSSDEVARYMLTDVYKAHSLDVRVVKPAIVPDGAVITGSRDCLVKLWVPNGDKTLQEYHVFAGATKFISSLCVLEPSTQYPNGLILAGSNDCSIYGFSTDSPEPIMRLLGHSDTVCALSAGKFGTIVSGSWDKTARIWSGQQCVLTLSGHQQSVWATEMFPTQNLILTGSADHTIRLWRHTGTCERTFYGHEDCVRGLVVKSEGEFLSCSNDQTVRLWRTSGECLQVYQGHKDYIYSITLMNNEFDFATCGEDQHVYLWQQGKCVQKFAFPCKSLWSLTCMSNGDIAAGGSDGRLYVLKKFTAEIYAEFLRESKCKCNLHQGNGVCNCGVLPNFHKCKEDTLIGDQNIGDCATSEDADPAPYDGEKRIYFDEEIGSLGVYVWNAAAETWEKSSEAVEGFSGTIGSMYSRLAGPVERRDEDIVLNVDVEGAIYKLCFRKDENPWNVAQNFVAEHNLSVEHVSQVVEFIIKNTGSTAGNVASGGEQPTEKIPEHFLVKNYCIYPSGNLKGLRKKLVELNDLVPKTLQIPSSQIDDLLALAELPDAVTEEQLALLDSALIWNDEFRFPVLDLLRLAVRSKGMSAKIGSQSFVAHLLIALNSTKHCINRILIIKTICNLFDSEEGEKAVIGVQSKIYESVKEALCISDTSIQKAGVSLFLNFAVASIKGLSVDLDTYCITLLEILGLLSDPEAVYRGLVTVGTLYTNDSLAAGYFSSLNIKNVLKSFEKFSENIKIMDALNVLTHVLIGS